MSNSRRHNRSNTNQVVKRLNQVKPQNVVQNNVDIHGNTPLHTAIIKFEHIKTVITLLNKGANIHAKNYDNCTPLDIAIQKNKNNVASLLIKRGALVGENLIPLLLSAIYKNNHKILKMIINHRVQNNPSINLIIPLKAAISKWDPIMIEAIIPHCGFLTPSDLYIPGDFVTDSNSSYVSCVELLLKWNFVVHPHSHRNEEFVNVAVEKGYLSIIVDLLKHGINVNMIISKVGLNLLTIACLNKHHEIVEKLLEHKANINVRIFGENEKLNKHSCFLNDMLEFRNLFGFDDPRNDSINVTCLHIAVFNADWITADILLRYGAKITDDAELFNLACTAAKNGCGKFISKFLDLGVKVTDVNPHGQTLLHFFLYDYTRNKDDSCYNIVKLLLEKGANIHLQTPGNSLVYEAISYEHRKIAQLFLDYNADVQYISPDGNTVLHQAIGKHFDANFIRTLLKLNSPVNMMNDDRSTPLHNACTIESGDQLKIIEALLHYNATIDCVDRCLMTPLHFASNHKNLQVVRTLLNNGANPNVMNNVGQTPLHIACISRNDMTASILQLLLEHGADIEAVDAKRWTPLFKACEYGNYDAVKCLLENHANPNHTDMKNLTSLHVAIKPLNVPKNYFYITHIVQLLIKFGANINILDKTNRTPLHYAIEEKTNYSEDNSRYVLYLHTCYEELIKVLVLQRIKLETAGLEVKNCHLNVAYNPDDQVKCEQEIEQMKKEIIGIDDLTFYDLLKGNMYLLRSYFENDEVQQILEMGVHDEKFPLYIDIIRNRLRDVKIRYKEYMLKISAREYFRMNISQRLPTECIDEVLSYLNIGEVKMFIAIMEPYNVKFL